MLTTYVPDGHISSKHVFEAYPVWGLGFCCPGYKGVVRGYPEMYCMNPNTIPTVPGQVV